MKSVQQLYSKYRTVKYQKGEIIFMQNTTPETAYAIKSGIVRVYTMTHDYDERSISFIVKDEILPICWLFSKTETTLFYYIAHTDCELYVLDKEMFQRQIHDSKTAAYTLLEHSINDYVTKALQITALEQTRAIDRILHTMNYFSLRYGRHIVSDLVRIGIPLTQKDIASFAGLTRETVAVEMSTIRRKNIITSKNKFYTVNTTNLHKFINDDQTDNVDIAENGPLT